MATKKKSAKKPQPSKPAHKPAKKSNNKSHSNKTTKEGQTMTENTQSIVTTSAVATLLASIDAKLGELVQIETYLANKALEASKTISVPTAPISAPPVQQPSIPAVTAPAQQPATPAVPSRPGASTVGGLVWSYCDGLSQQLGRAPSKDELIAAIKQFSPTLNGQPVNELTAATQYSKWRSATGLPRLPRGFAANKPTPAAVAAQPAPAAASNLPPGAVPSFAPSQPVQTQMPIPAAQVPSVIAPTAPVQQPVPTVAGAANLPPWLRANSPSVG